MPVSKNVFLESLDGNQNVYLNRHFPNRLTITEIKQLPLERIKAYIKKHKSLQYKYKDTDYIYSQSDLEYNSYWGTSCENQFRYYFKKINLIIQSLEEQHV